MVWERIAEKEIKVAFYNIDYIVVDDLTFKVSVLCFIEKNGGGGGGGCMIVLRRHDTSFAWRDFHPCPLLKTQVSHGETFTLVLCLKHKCRMERLSPLSSA